MEYNGTTLQGTQVQTEQKSGWLDSLITALPGMASGAAQIISASKGNPSSVNNYFGDNDPSGGGINTKQLLIYGGVGLLLLGLVIFLVLPKK